MKKLLLFCLLVLACGCDKAVGELPANAPPAPLAIRGPNNGRFDIKSYGLFNAGFDDNTREILVLTDTQTGEEYLCITGVGVTELRRESRQVGKTRQVTTKEE